MEQRQGGEGGDAQGYGFGIGNAFRSLIPTGGPSPPRDKTKEELQKSIAEINYLRMENKRGREEFRGLRHAYHEVDHERARLKDNNSSLQEELSTVRREFEEYKARFNVSQETETVGTQALITKADSLTIADVVDKVRILNEEIFQAAASLAESLVHSKRDCSIEDMQRYQGQACSLIGESMVDLLINQAQQPKPEVNPFVMQAVLSIFLVGFCVSKLDSWYPADSALASFLETLYDGIRRSEEQTVSGRWRSLTRSRTRPATESWKAELIEMLRSILSVAAWDSLTKHQSAFERNLIPIFKAVEDLRIALWEKFTSADLEVNIVRAGSEFEPWMEDTYDGGRQSGGKKANHKTVAGTTGIGLKQIMISKVNQNPQIFGPVLSPKVVLESTLHEALQSPPSKSKKKATQAHLDGKGDICRTCGRDM